MRLLLQTYFVNTLCVHVIHNHKIVACLFMTCSKTENVRHVILKDTSYKAVLKVQLFIIYTIINAKKITELL